MIWLKEIATIAASLLFSSGGPSGSSPSVPFGFAPLAVYVPMFLGITEDVGTGTIDKGVDALCQRTFFQFEAL